MLKRQLARFNHIMQGIERIYEDYAKSVGLTYMSLTVLQIISYAETPCTQKEICEQSHYNKQIVNSIIRGFTDKGYLAFREVESDRRNKHVLLTEKGKAYATEILAPLCGIEQKAITVLSKKERESLLDMLEKCYHGYLKAQLKIKE